MEAKELRDAVIETLVKDKSTAVSKLDGNYFYGADIAVEDSSSPKVFRLTVIEHNQQKKFT